MMERRKLVITISQYNKITHHTHIYVTKIKIALLKSYICQLYHYYLFILYNTEEKRNIFVESDF